MTLLTLQMFAGIHRAAAAAVAYVIEMQSTREGKQRMSPCNCGNTSGQKYEVTTKDGTTVIKNTEAEAMAMANRTGGTYKVAS
jgi:hypothetical protein